MVFSTSRPQGARGECYPMIFLYGKLSITTFAIGELPTHGKRSMLNYNNGIGLVEEEKLHPVQAVLTVNQLKLLVDWPPLKQLVLMY